MTPSYLPSDEPPQKINILTLNCWGLKFISKYRRERLHEIGRRLANSDYPPEIVGLQECWTQEDYENIRKETRHILPYGKFYFGGIFGAGLAILSKWPIEESSMFEYPLNGRPTAFFRGDWFVGKGVASARIRFGPGRNDVASVFCTHLHAPYEKEPNDSYICHRTAQAWEIAKLMRGATEKGHLVIGLGDFNMLPLSLAHRVITLHAPVEDAWRLLHPESSIGAAVDGVEKRRNKPVPTGDLNITENGATCDGIFNTWRWSKQDQKRLQTEGPIPVDGSHSDPLGKRLDYIFVGQGTQVTPWKWAVESTRVSMMERHPGLHCSLSDHFAVEATVRRNMHDGDDTDLESGEESASFLPIQKHIESLSPSRRDSVTPAAVFHATAPLPPTTERSTVTTPPSPTAPTSNDIAHLYDQILTMTASYVARERFQRQFRLAHFLLSIVVSIACFVGIWWSPRAFVSFILCIVSTLSFAAGVLDGLIGGLFVGSELRSLKEFEWEVRNARRTVLGLGLDIERDLGSSPRK